jgi:hypothetical protein
MAKVQKLSLSFGLMEVSNELLEHVKSGMEAGYEYISEHYA